jgi:hypothetical protein
MSSNTVLFICIKRTLEELHLALFTSRCKNKFFLKLLKILLVAKALVSHKCITSTMLCLARTDLTNYFSTDISETSALSFEGGERSKA